MFPALTDLIHHLQDFSTHYPGDNACLRVEVITSAHAQEQFEIREVHQEGPALVLSCQPIEPEAAQPQDGAPPPRASAIRACVHNDYEDLC